MAPKLLLVGGGKMGSALLSGLLSAKWALVSDLAVSETDAAQRARLEAALRALGATGPRRVLSIVAGISSDRLAEALPAGSVVLRAMPNTPSLIGAGMAGLSGGVATTSTDLDWAEGILSAVGRVVRLPERDLDAVTGISGSGPAYVFLVAEAMVEAGVTAGLTRQVAKQLVVGTFLGASKMLDETGQEPADLRAVVTSPGGTTAAAVRTLEFKAVRSAFIEAVAAATERSRPLGR